MYVLSVVSLDLKFSRLHLAQKIFELFVVCGHYIIDVPVSEIKPRCYLFLSRWEQRLYEIRFVWKQKDVGEKRGTIRTHWNADCLLEDFSGKNNDNIVN